MSRSDHSAVAECSMVALPTYVAAALPVAAELHLAFLALLVVGVAAS